ncbi:helix-turn-helix domain-containing protein [Flavobacterium chilense]|uniref:Helix-turn-helix n=1 Tax=Flavobacterium chilense TaxID=946677 RepID=A0A1M7ERG0_9FLAO|nr:helix-turn-helix transcriptional regulator [Flavobacterium chilense]SHL94270.1 Helix-turn-helix [Flavobacterium chilense]
MSTINEKIDDLAIKEYKGNNSAFAKAMGTSEANIRNYRKGIIPKLDFIIKLHEVFGISFEWLLLDKNDEFSSDKTKIECLDIETAEYKLLSLENDLLKERLKFQQEQIEFYKNNIDFLTSQNPVNKVMSPKEIESGLNIIDEIESISLKKSRKSIK